MHKRAELLGWLALGLGTILACFWAFWGSMEAYHEGWFKPSLGGRILQTLPYYLPMAVCLLLTFVSFCRSRIGAVLWTLVGLAFSFFIFYARRSNLDLGLVLSWLPTTLMLVGIGALAWFGQIAARRRLAALICIGLPLLTALGFAAEPLWRVSQRVDDGIRTERLVQGNGVALIWAPEGPGWVMDAKEACRWEKARDICAHLSADGTRLEEQELNIWRLPSVDEAVASLTRHGENAGGSWDPVARKARYRITPDKESPLWAVYHETIYWWTGTEVDADKAYRIVYNGQVYANDKQLGMGTLGFRAVREP